MFYPEALEYMTRTEKRGSVYGLDRMKILLSVLGKPDKKLKFIHVAGTNGKGSVTAFLASILKNAGYIVGAFTSPAVFSYNEKFSVSGVGISDADVARFITEIKSAVDNENERRKDAGGDEFSPTAFEMETALALLYFAYKKCDVCILETGCGGRLDSTNAIEEKELAVITPIGVDHCALLGDTVEKIAAEKAAITKDVVVTARQSDGIMREIELPYDETCKGRIYRSVKVIAADEPEAIKHGLDGQEFTLSGENYFIRLLGEHQLINAAIAVKAAETLNGKRISGSKEVWQISGESIKKGLSETEWPARLEVIIKTENRFNIAIPRGKALVLDGAHNPQGASKLADAVRDYFGGKRVSVVLGVLNDKDAEGIVKALAPIAQRFIAVASPSPRALSAKSLQNITAEYRPSDVGRDIRGTVITELGSDADAVLLCGSLTLFAELKSR